jgi:hypothetical protein
MNAAPAVANEYLESIHLEGGRREICDPDRKWRQDIRP